MLGSVLKSVLGGRRPSARKPLSAHAILEGVSAEIAGLSPGEAAAMLENRFARGIADAAEQCMLGMFLLRLDRPDDAARVFAAMRAAFPAHGLWHYCRVGEALARARMARARGERAPLLELPPAARRTPVSVVICSVTPERFARVSARYGELLREVPHEIVGVHDARSLCDGYNRGLRRAAGDLIVFSHDDVEVVSTDFASKLHAGLADADMLAVAGSDWASGANWNEAGAPHIYGQVAHPSPDGGYEVTVYGVRVRIARGIEAFDGLMFAARRETAACVGFDEERFDGWHFYDLDFSLRAARMGCRIQVRSDLLVFHDSIGAYGDDWKRYARRFTAKHRNALRPKRPATPAAPTIVTHSLEEWPELTEQLLVLPAEPEALPPAPRVGAAAAADNARRGTP